MEGFQPGHHGTPALKHADLEHKVKVDFVITHLLVMGVTIVLAELGRQLKIATQIFVVRI